MSVWQTDTDVSKGGCHCSIHTENKWVTIIHALLLFLWNEHSMWSSANMREFSQTAASRLWLSHHITRMFSVSVCNLKRNKKSWVKTCLINQILCCWLQFEKTTEILPNDFLVFLTSYKESFWALWFPKMVNCVT